MPAAFVKSSVSKWCPILWQKGMQASKSFPGLHVAGDILAPEGSGAIPRKCNAFINEWFSGLYAAKTADQSSGAVTIFSVSGLMLN
jgi:hypothetical protein